MRRWVLTEREDLTWRVLRAAAAGPDQTCAITLPEIARRSGVCRRTAVEHLRRLEQLGRVRRIGGGCGRGKITVYRAPRDFRRSSWERWEREKVQTLPPPSPSSLLGGETVPRAGVSARENGPGSRPPAAASPRRGPYWHLSERDLADRERRDATYRRLADLGAIADPCEQRREQWHGLIARARRKAVNVLAFVAGVVRRGFWRVVGERDREFARDEIRALDLPAPRLARTSVSGRRRIPGTGITIIPRAPRCDTERSAASILETLLPSLNIHMDPKPTPFPTSDYTDRGLTDGEAMRMADVGQRAYALIVHDRKRPIAAHAMLQGGGFRGDFHEMLGAGRRFAETSGSLENWRRALARDEERETRGESEPKRVARATPPPPTIGKVYGE